MRIGVWARTGMIAAAAAAARAMVEKAAGAEIHPALEALEVFITALTPRNVEEPVERVLVVGEESIEGRRGVEDDAGHDHDDRGDSGHRPVRIGCRGPSRLSSPQPLAAAPATG